LSIESAVLKLRKFQANKGLKESEGKQQAFITEGKMRKLKEDQHRT
jgi:hypothetical protein